MNANQEWKWNSYGDAPLQNSMNLIPKGTLVPVSLKIIAGAYNDPAQGWEGGWATQNKTTGSVYLKCEFTGVSGPYKDRKVWGMIGLHSNKGDVWAAAGRSFIRAILSSARKISNTDKSDRAQKLLSITGFQELNGLVFLARIDIENNPERGDKNVIRFAINSDHSEYATHMGMAKEKVSQQVAIDDEEIPF